MKLQHLLTHPRLFSRKALGKLHRLALRRPPSEPTVRSIKGRIRFEHRALPFLWEEDRLYMYTGSYDLILEECMKSHLSEGGIFIDVGANVGYIAALAACYCGTTGQVHGFEPLPECYARLEALRSLNPEYPFFFHNVAIGAENTTLTISYDPEGGARNASLVPGTQGASRTVVQVRRLDEYIFANVAEPQRIQMIKIDVEGYEFPVLVGLERFLADGRFRSWIVCEIKPWEIQKLGNSMTDFRVHMERFGYRAYDMIDQDHAVDLDRLNDMEVILFRPA